MTNQDSTNPTPGPTPRNSGRLRQRCSELETRLRQFKDEKLALDLTRGKPSAEQLDLANALDGILAGDFMSEDGTDTRNYGALEGIPEMRRLAADYLGVAPEAVLIGGNSSLQLMYLYVLWAMHFGPDGREPWKDAGTVKMLCPVPGYDRHFALTEEIGIEMVSVAMNADGPDMDAVEQLIETDPSVRGIWCVPKHSNPSGATYSDEVVTRIARLGHQAHSGFRVLWDNAYAVHDLSDPGPVLANVLTIAEGEGTADSVVLFGSWSKVTFGGAGIAFLAASPLNLAAFAAREALMTIGPDKVNQLRHVRLFENLAGIQAHMRRHASILSPKFECVQRHLQGALAGKDMGRWTTPSGGYFVSFDAPEGTASRIVALAAEHGVKLTPAGAAYPYGTDPRDSHIRLAPSFPPLPELEKAMAVFVTCVELVCTRRQLGSNV